MNEQLISARVLQPPASVASSATTTCMFDTIGYDYAVIDVLSGTQSTTDAAITTITLKESDDTVATNFAAIVAFTGAASTSTSAGFAIPAVTVTGNGAGIQLQVDLRKRKRYLQLNCTPGTTLVMGAVVELGRAEQAALTAAQKSVTNKSATNVTGCAVIANG
jgi:short-subunit dehydrogenase involved in D-alanine esterification of teichoic acids